jgi:hypothetical protein
LNKKDYSVRISIDEANIEYDVLDLATYSEPQLLARTNGSRAIEIFRCIEKCCTRVHNCWFLEKCRRNCKTELSEEAVGAVRTSSSTEGVGKGVSPKNVWASSKVMRMLYAFKQSLPDFAERIRLAKVESEVIVLSLWIQRNTGRTVNKPKYNIGPMSGRILVI